MEDLIKALQIFLKYGNPKYPTNCSYNVLYVDIDPEIVADEDNIMLEKLGFMPSDKNDGYISYKYGSC